MDDELQLVLELSKKTFEEEEKARKLKTDDDLIDLECPEEKQRKKNIDQLKKLYAEPSSEFERPGPSIPRTPNIYQTPWQYNNQYKFGGSSSVPHNFSLANTTTYFHGTPPAHTLPSTPVFNFATPVAPWTYDPRQQPRTTTVNRVADTDNVFLPPAPGFLPLEAPPPRPPKQYTTPQPPFPPVPSINLLRDIPPPLPPKTHRRLLNFNSNLSSSSSASAYSFNPASTVTEDTSFTTRTASSVTSNDSHSPYQPITHLYVPYTMTNLNPTYGALMENDLIDLSFDTCEDSEVPSMEEIRKEFDPLYRPTSRMDESANSFLSNFKLESNKNYEVSVSPAIKIRTDQQSTASEDQESSMDDSLSEDIDLRHWTIDLVEKQDNSEKKAWKFMRQTDSTSSYFIAPTVNFMTTKAESIKIMIFKDKSILTLSQKLEIAMTCEIVESVDVLIAQALLLFISDHPYEVVDPEEYGLKIYGLNQFLDRTTTIGQHLYTGQCLLHGADVKLELSLLKQKPRYFDQFYPSWDKMKSLIRYSSTLDREDMLHYLNGLIMEMRKFEQSFENGSTLELSTSSQRVKEEVKLICRMLNSIVPGKLYSQMQKYLASTTNDQLRFNRTDFAMELRNFVEIYCKCTTSGVCVNQKESHKSKREVLTNTDHLRIMLNSIHSLPENWLRYFSEFYVSIDIYYGTQVLDGHCNRIPKTVKTDQFFPRIPLELYAVFKRLTINRFPRETRIVISLSGVVADGVTLPSNMTLDTSNPMHLLAYTSVPLYDEQLIMRQGPLFLPLTILKKEPMVKPFGPYPYIKNERDPVLIISFKLWDHIYYFPDVSVDLQCIPQDFSTLDHETQEYLLELIEKEEPSQLQNEDQEIIWQKRLYLTLQPEALPYVLSSQNDWSFAFLSQIYQLLEEWAPLRPEIALQLLLPQYPDERVRTYAVQRLSKASSDYLFHSLPQIIEALRFELSEQSALAQFVFELAMVNLDFTFEIYWQLQQRVDHCAVDDLAYAIRCQKLQQKIIDEHDCENLRQDIKLQHDLLNELDSIQDELRSRTNDSETDRITRLRTRLGTLDSRLLSQKVRLPICPSFDCTGIRVSECTIFNSNAKPLKIIFRGLNCNYSIIHKRDDDMRQDAFVMKMVNDMDRIWRMNNLDLRMITFRVMPVGYRKGMGELVLNCATLLEIQKEDGLKGVLKDTILQTWLMKHNSSEFTYNEALDNFIRSCAGWCVVTYVLGIGDRHNDNILFTKNGHVFHIDFGKYMGDWQTAAGFRRDRVPFVFTSEMFYVINGGRTQTQNYQTFVDYCCRAFNCLRRNRNTLTNLLRLMACSDISGINLNSIAFVEKNLMLDLSETDATIQFTELIQNSLNSSFVRLNFVAHTVAQFMSSSSSFSKTNENKISFIPDLHTRESEGTIESISVTGFEKRYIPSKVYLYKIEVRRENVVVPSVIYRSFAETDELYTKLRRRFPNMAVQLTTSSNMRSNVRAVAQKRMVDVHNFFQYLMTAPIEIGHCDLVYTFFHSLLRDNKCEQYIDPNMGVGTQCQVYLKVQYNGAKQALNVFVGHVKNLAILQTGQMPDPYVKTYVRPDMQSYSKRKTQVVRGTQNPTFNQELSYEAFPQNLLSTRVLEVSVWNNGGLMDNHKMYMVCIPLQKITSIQEDRKSNRVLEGWFNCEKYI